MPAVAWELQSQFAPVYMHFNIIFLRCLWEDMNISQWKNCDRTFFFSWGRQSAFAIPHPDTLRISLVIVDGELHLDHGLIVGHRDGHLRDGAGGVGGPGRQQHEAQGSQWSWQHDYWTAAQFDDLWSGVSDIRDVILILFILLLIFITDNYR